MPFKPWLTQTQFDSVKNAILQTVGYDQQTRQALIGALPASIRNLLQSSTAPGIAVVLDLQALNQIERLNDGTVPLIVFLRSVLSVAGPVAALSPLRDALNDVEARSSGAPKVSLAAVPELQEKILGGHNDMVTLGFLERGLAIAESVAKLEVPRFDAGSPRIGPGGQPQRYLGTGWLLAPNLLITNYHVFNARNTGEAPASVVDLHLQVEATTARFDYDHDDVAGTPVKLEALLAWDQDLDYAVARLSIEGRAPLPRASVGITAVEPGSSIPVNIIQHPYGEPKRFGIRNNLATAATERDLRYLTDTDGGSSGSPVLNDEWAVVALHRGATFADGVSFQGRTTAYVNIGTQLSAILTHIKNEYPDLSVDLPG